jgi:hypothetical protein
MTGQGYASGMKFVQFYFGLPIAMNSLSSRGHRFSGAQGLVPPTSISASGLT